MNKYRVDRALSRRVPCGMNSILYCGDNWNKANAIFDNARCGVDTWSNENSAYGVILSVWHGQHSCGEYVIKREKGLD